MTDATPAQIEAAAKAMFLDDYEGQGYSWNHPDRKEEKAMYCHKAKVALTAAAAVGYDRNVGDLPDIVDRLSVMSDSTLAIDAVAEIERLRAIADTDTPELEEQHQEILRLRAEREITVHQTIERCAQVAEEVGKGYESYPHSIIRAIRALKDKP